MKTLFNIIFWLFAVSTAFADGVIPAKSAAKLIKDSQVQLISARKSSAYSKVHLPGAIHLDHTSLYAPGSVLKSSSELKKILEARGINSAKHLIIYDDGAMTSAGRMYWIFKYLGVKEVSVVDGGMKAWRVARLPVTKNPVAAKKSTFTVQVKPTYLAKINDVSAATKKSNYVVLDVRTPEEYNGTAGAASNKGHIPGAINIPHKELLNANGTFKSKAELASIFSKNGITAGTNVIVYCQTSVRAGVAFVALNGILNYNNVKVYDGAYLEWSEKMKVEL